MLRHLEELVHGQSVALVGNSEKLLRADPSAGPQIDGHDVVIRMNLGIPGRVDGDKIGHRTDVLTLGKFWNVELPKDCIRLVWMKLTPMGNAQLKQLRASMPTQAIDVWPADYEERVKEFVGASPGTGIRILWWLKTIAEPRSVSCYGMDCWEAPSHWSGRMNAPAHIPTLERRAMLRLL